MPSRLPSSSHPRFKALILVLILCTVLVLSRGFPNTLRSVSTRNPHDSKMGITHIVLFKFKADASAGAINQISERMLGLKDTCIHPTSKAPYIKSASGGTDNSPEGIQNGFTHAFVMEFETADDRDYYVNKDPVHEEFKALAGKIMDKAQVLDFENGVFKL